MQLDHFCQRSGMKCRLQSRSWPVVGWRQTLQLEKYQVSSVMYTFRKQGFFRSRSYNNIVKWQLIGLTYCDQVESCRRSSQILVGWNVSSHLHYFSQNSFCKYPIKNSFLQNRFEIYTFNLKLFSFSQFLTYLLENIK